jgi:hypothetical protein
VACTSGEWDLVDSAPKWDPSPFEADALKKQTELADCRVPIGTRWDPTQNENHRAIPMPCATFQL